MALVRGTMHGIAVAAFGFICPHAFEVTLAVSRGPFGLLSGSLGSVGGFLACLTGFDKIVDSVIAITIEDAYGLDFLPIKDLARLETPEVAIFATFVVGWAACA